MQDIHSIGGGGGGGGGRLFGGGDRRLRPHHHGHGHGSHGPQALKCPRCESLNTKFCYYNNYNLSQPRHFCKSCRRYWTKGGVLRNVPVGGGCRKTKRSKPKSSSTSNNRSSETAAVRKSPNSQNSSSDSSSLTATTTTAAANTTATASATAPVEVLSTNSAPTMLNFQESSSTGNFLNITQSSTPPNPSFDPTLLDHSSAENHHIFPEIGTFTSLIASSSTALGFSNTSPFRLHHMVENSNTNQNQWMHTDAIGDELKTSSLAFMNKGTEDWNNGGTDEALFDLTGSVDQSYWNQTQWGDDDHDHDHGNHHHQLNYLP